MSGEWIKMRGSLLNNPKVIRIARLLIDSSEFMAWYLGNPRDVTRNGAPLLDGQDRSLLLNPPVTRVTVGALLSLWSTVNECAGSEGVLKATDLFEIDTMCGVPGIGYALQKVGWIDVLPNGEGVRFVNFHEHNTVTRERSTNAKSNAERQAEFRARKKAERNDESNDESNVTRNRREEKKREESIPPTPRGPSRFPEFWLAWPATDRKTRKADCEKKWKAKGCDAVADRILAHVDACKRTRKWQDGFEPAPMTYLNGRMWEDGEPDAGLFGGETVNRV